MKQKIVIASLIVCGVLLLAFGFFMDTTVPSVFGDRIYNLGLQARQQSLLITGGVLLIAGVLLHGFRMLKQTPEELAKERADDDEARRKREEQRQADAAEAERQGERLEEAVSSAISVVVDTGRDIRGYFHFGARRSEYWSRFAVGVIVGIWLGFVCVLLYGALIGAGGFLIGLLVVAACVGFAFRAAPQVSVMKQLWSAAVIVASITLAVATYTVVKLRASLATNWVPQQDGYAEFVNEVIRMEQVLVVYLVVFGITAVAFLLTRRAEKKAAEQPIS